MSVCAIDVSLSRSHRMQAHAVLLSSGGTPVFLDSRRLGCRSDLDGLLSWLEEWEARLNEPVVMVGCCEDSSWPMDLQDAVWRGGRSSSWVAQVEVNALEGAWRLFLPRPSLLRASLMAFSKAASDECEGAAACSRGAGDSVVRLVRDRLSSMECDLLDRPTCQNHRETGLTQWPESPSMEFPF